jgi:hypothetical protein
MMMSGLIRELLKDIIADLGHIIADIDKSSEQARCELILELLA